MILTFPRPAARRIEDSSSSLLLCGLQRIVRMRNVM
jgi:hypothetical protein